MAFGAKIVDVEGEGRGGRGGGGGDVMGGGGGERERRKGEVREGEGGGTAAAGEECKHTMDAARRAMRGRVGECKRVIAWLISGGRGFEACGLSLRSGADRRGGDYDAAAAAAQTPSGAELICARGAPVRALHAIAANNCGCRHELRQQGHTAGQETMRLGLAQARAAHDDDRVAGSVCT